MREKFLSKIRISDDGALCRASDEALDEAEKAARIKFPESYRNFAREIGGGVISRYYRVFVPLDRKSPFDLTTEAARIAKHLKKDLQERGEKHMSENFFSFASTIAGDIFVWETAETEQPAEFPIYIVLRDSQKVEKIAADFTDFIEKVCLGKKLTEVVIINDYRIYKEFEPFSTKKTEAKRKNTDQKL